MMRYAIVIEKTPNNYSAYAPDLPGCAATGATLADKLKKRSNFT
jgi:predicted RNase H-like HicB family nuclease